MAYKKSATWDSPAAGMKKAPHEEGPGGGGMKEYSTSQRSGTINLPKGFLVSMIAAEGCPWKI